MKHSPVEYRISIQWLLCISMAVNLVTTESQIVARVRVNYWEIFEGSNIRPIIFYNIILYHVIYYIIRYMLVT